MTPPAASQGPIAGYTRLPIAVAEHTQHTERSPSRRVALIALAVVAVVGAVAFVLLTTGAEDQDGGRTGGAPGVAREVSAEDLRAFAEERGNPVFWAGEITGMKLEFTETTRGHVFVRYLPELAPIGDDRGLYATVATYPQPDAIDAVRQAGDREGNVTREVRGGGLATWSRSQPNSVYVGVPGIDFLVEVFHSEARRAQELAVSGRVRPARQ